jgi:hypothetical protein
MHVARTGQFEHAFPERFGTDKAKDAADDGGGSASVVSSTLSSTYWAALNMLTSGSFDDVV